MIYTDLQVNMHYNMEDLAEHIAYTLNHHENLKLALAYLDPQGRSSIDHWTDTNFYADHNTFGNQYCCCNHPIQIEYRAMHKETGDTLTLGSKCIKKFFNKTIIKKFKRAKDLHDNPNSKHCETCIKKLPDSHVAKFPNGQQGNGKHYHIKCFQPIARKLDQARKRARELAKEEVLLQQVRHKTFLETIKADRLERKQPFFPRREVVELCKILDKPMRFGKYRNKTIGQVYFTDRDYLCWCFEIDKHAKDIQYIFHHE